MSISMTMTMTYSAVLALLVMAALAGLVLARRRSRAKRARAIETENADRGGSPQLGPAFSALSSSSFTPWNPLTASPTPSASIHDARTSSIILPARPDNVFAAAPIVLRSIHMTVRARSRIALAVRAQTARRALGASEIIELAIARDESGRAHLFATSRSSGRSRWGEGERNEKNVAQVLAAFRRAFRDHTLSDETPSGIRPAPMRRALEGQESLESTGSMSGEASERPSAAALTRADRGTVSAQGAPASRGRQRAAG